MSFRLAIQTPQIGSGRRSRRQSLVEAILDELLANPFDRGPPAAQGIDDLGIGFGRAALGLIRQQEDTSPHQLPCGSLTRRDERLQVVPLGLGQRHAITLLHGTRSVVENDLAYPNATRYHPSLHS